MSVLPSTATVGAPVDLLSRVATEGYGVVNDILAPDACDRLSHAVAKSGTVRPGNRNQLTEPWCADLSRTLRQHAALTGLIPGSHLAVQCTFFEKSSAQSWLVPVHQDLSIPVAEHVDHMVLSGWSVKDGTPFVQAPVEVLEQLVAVRLHLDACAEEDGALRVVPGSHRQGVISPQDAAEVRKTDGEQMCVVRKGGVLVMKPLLLHASSKASGASRRRVLHFLYGPAELPFGLKWSFCAQGQGAFETRRNP